MTDCIIVKLRKERGLSRSALARQAGIARTTLEKLEMGLNLSMSPKTSNRLSRFFGIPADEIEQEFLAWRQELVTM